ncbi:uncharacterized protein K452DRAFT_285562 [Aplosporella prunicola CBS 121167]|uniref:Uncharacterized protein n=1 Tax=Aplosporella prunicola CBS 121167 TaxID=1176127 RepID=A0A6A6BJJ5_9PEZI|nr:uncharacterized protein K452DRAFT_285562 [Aplosporella prunicola CBS 121167]KAF2144319.1 hypothetical protein K452DRAFT_285562 [Aplosporella prunicola CBS 121167]
MSTYGSGPGYGNKTAGNNHVGDTETAPHFGSAGDSAPYSGSNESGSGTTGGAGVGNKTGSHEGRQRRDSTIGKMMEKAGSMLHSPKIEQKGHAKREAAGHYFAGATTGNGHEEHQHVGGSVGGGSSGDDEMYSPATGDRVRPKAGGGHGADQHEGMHGAVGGGAVGGGTVGGTAAAAARDVSPMDTSAAAADQVPGDQYGSSERTGYGRDTSYETGRDNY